MEIRFSYKDVPTIKRFSKSDKFLRGLMGPFGSGKSTGCVIEIVKRAAAQPISELSGKRMSRWGIIRNTYQQLRDTTIKTFHSWLPPDKFGVWHVSDHTYRITNIEGLDIEVMFRALDRPDQVSNLLSLELTGAWVNEAREVPWTIIQALQGRVGRYPAKKDGGCGWHGIIMDTNPPDEDSWWYRLFEERRPENAEVFKQPSGMDDAAENLSNLPNGYYKNLLSSMDAESARVYVHGAYGFIRDGKPVFPEYSDQYHCAPCSPISGSTIYRGWDFGLTPACVFSQMTPNGQWIIFDEMIAESMGIKQFGEQVNIYSARTYPGFEFEDIGDPAGSQRAQTDEKTCFQILRAMGVDIVPGDQTLQIRLESVRFALNTMIGGRPAFQIDPRCKVTRKGYQGRYKYRRMQTSVERYADVPDKNEYSHPQDANQYVATRLFGHLIKNRYDQYDDDEEDSFILQYGHKHKQDGRSGIGGY